MPERKKPDQVNRMPMAVDYHVSRRLRLRRRQLGLRQKDVAEIAGLSWQQYQKYEAGTNRVTAGRLYFFAQILHTPVAWFFEGAERV